MTTLAAWLMLALATPPQGAAPPSPEHIVSRYIAARGGMARIKAVRSLIYRGAPRPDGRPGRFMAKARPFYALVGEPGPARDFAEGNDGTPWEFYENPGLVIRSSGAPAAAMRHTAYFDDPLVYFGEPGWRYDAIAAEPIDGRPAYGIRATYPDGFTRDLFVDAENWLLVASRATAPIHAFGDPVLTETRIGDYRDLDGALFPARFAEHEIATGKQLSDGQWQTLQANVPLPHEYFAPPEVQQSPLTRMLNAAYAARAIPTDALGWYLDFRGNPLNSGTDTNNGIQGVAYQALKAGAVDTAVLLLEHNVRDYPESADAHFALGRAYRTAGREAEAVARFERALAIAPDHPRAKAALSAKSPR